MTRAERLKIAATLNRIAARCLHRETAIALDQLIDRFRYGTVVRGALMPRPRRGREAQ